MRWQQTSARRWESLCGRGRVADYSRDGDSVAYFAMWYRVEPGRGVWEIVRSDTGKETFRRSLPAACEAVAAVVEALDAEEREAA